MGAAVIRFGITVAALPVCAQFMDGVRLADMQNTLIVGLILAVIFTVLRPIMRLLLSVLNFCTSLWMHGWCRRRQGSSTTA